MIVPLQIMSEDEVLYVGFLMYVYLINAQCCCVDVRLSGMITSPAGYCGSSNHSVFSTHSARHVLSHLHFCEHT